MLWWFVVCGARPELAQQLHGALGMLVSKPATRAKGVVMSKPAALHRRLMFHGSGHCSRRVFGDGMACSRIYQQHARHHEAIRRCPISFFHSSEKATRECQAAGLSAFPSLPPRRSVLGHSLTRRGWLVRDSRAAVSAPFPGPWGVEG